MPRMKIDCTGKEGDLFQFVYNQITTLGVTEKFFSLTEAEILEIKEREYPTLPNRYQFGLIEPLIGKMVMTLEFLYTVEDFPSKSIEVVEK